MTKSDANLAPGVMRCAKCEIQLIRTNLYVKSGASGAGDSKTEPCPNGCGPLWPVTWKQYAEQAHEQLDKHFDEYTRLKKVLEDIAAGTGDAVQIARSALAEI